MAITERKRLEWSVQGLARSPVWMLQSDDRPNRAALIHLLRHTLLDQQLDAIKRTLQAHEEVREAEAYQFEVLDTDPRWDGDYARMICNNFPTFSKSP